MRRIHLMFTSSMRQDVGAKASPQLRQARLQAETLLFTLQVRTNMPHDML